MGVGVGGVDACVMDLVVPSDIELIDWFPGAKIGSDDLEEVGVGVILAHDFEEKDFKWHAPWGYATVSLFGGGYVGLGHTPAKSVSDKTTTYGDDHRSGSRAKIVIHEVAKKAGHYSGEMVDRYKGQDEAIKALSGMVNIRHYKVSQADIWSAEEEITFLGDYTEYGRFMHFGASDYKGSLKRNFVAYVGVQAYPARVVGRVAIQGRCRSKTKIVEGEEVNAAEVLKKHVDGDSKKYFWFSEVYCNAKEDFVNVK